MTSQGMCGQLLLRRNHVPLQDDGGAVVVLAGEDCFHHPRAAKANVNASLEAQIFRLQVVGLAAEEI
jgi:hypothetical protein